VVGAVVGVECVGVGVGVGEVVGDGDGLGDGEGDGDGDDVGRLWPLDVEVEPPPPAACPVVGDVVTGTCWLLGVSDGGLVSCVRARTPAATPPARTSTARIIPATSIR
jgi:hypothetical protein